MDPLLTADDLAEVLHSTRQWVLRAAWQGKIPSRKVGRLRLFSIQDCESYIASVAQNQKDPWGLPQRNRRSP
jgi:excisionase family DNA binding protein